MTFTCVKLETETWPGLRARGDGAAAARRRLAAERESAREDARAETRRDEEKRAVRRAFAEKQWAIDDALERATRVSSSNARETRAPPPPPPPDVQTPSKTRAAAARPRLPSPPPVRAFIDVTVRMTDIPRAPARESYAHT